MRTISDMVKAAVQRLEEGMHDLSCCALWCAVDDATGDTSWERGNAIVAAWEQYARDPEGELPDWWNFASAGIAPRIALLEQWAEEHGDEPIPGLEVQ